VSVSKFNCRRKCKEANDNVQVDLAHINNNNVYMRPTQKRYGQFALPTNCFVVLSAN
jgi:hypothetical protein